MYDASGSAVVDVAVVAAAVMYEASGSKSGRGVPKAAKNDCGHQPFECMPSSILDANEKKEKEERPKKKTKKRKIYLNQVSHQFGRIRN